MSFALHIAFRNMDPSEAAETLVRQRAAALGEIAHRVSACRVVLDCEHPRNQMGRLYRVHIELTAPGGPVMVNRDRGSDHAHDDLLVAIRDAFQTVERKVRSLKTSAVRRGWAAKRTGAAWTAG